MAHSVAVASISNPPSVGSAGLTQLSPSEFHNLLYNTDLSDVFFNSQEFAITARYYHKALSSWSVYNVIFDDPHTSFSFGEGIDVSTIRPQFQVRESALRHSILKGDRCMINGKTYFVDDYMQDGVGVITVYLRLK
jgi:hypothetical protein